MDGQIFAIVIILVEGFFTRRIAVPCVVGRCYLVVMAVVVGSSDWKAMGSEVGVIWRMTKCHADRPRHSTVAPIAQHHLNSQAFVE